MLGSTSETLLINSWFDRVSAGDLVIQTGAATTRKLMDVLLSSGPGGGPFLSGANTRSGLVATLGVTVPSGTALATTNAVTTGAPTGWYANTAADFTGTSIAVTVAVSGAATVSFTFPTGTTFPAYLKHCGGKIGDTVADANGFTPSCYPDIRNLVCDTAIYPTGATGTDVEAYGLPLRPSVGAIVIS